MSYAQQRFGPTLEARSYESWREMNRRCYNPRCPDFPRYGGRGVAVARRWRGRLGFSSFLADMGTPPTERHTLDRLDNDGHYGPGLCRWATAKEQANNRSTTVRLTHAGRTLPLTAWADELEIHPKTLRSRLAAGWAVEDALTRPVRRRRAARRHAEVEGVVHPADPHDEQHVEAPLAQAA